MSTQWYKSTSECYYSGSGAVVMLEIIDLPQSGVDASKRPGLGQEP